MVVHTNTHTIQIEGGQLGTHPTQIVHHWLFFLWPQIHRQMIAKHNLPHRWLFFNLLTNLGMPPAQCCRISIPSRSFLCSMSGVSKDWNHASRWAPISFGVSFAKTSSFMSGQMFLLSSSSSHLIIMCIEALCMLFQGFACGFPSSISRIPCMHAWASKGVIVVLLEY